MIAVAVLLGQEDTGLNPLGDNLLPLLLLAIGGALLVGNVVAIVRPPEQRRNEADLDRAPVARSLGFALIGLVATVWAVATLVT